MFGFPLRRLHCNALRNVRYLSIDSALWTRDHRLTEPLLAGELRKVLLLFKKLPLSAQQEILLLTPLPAQHTLELHLQLSRGATHSDIFTHISKHVNCKLDAVQVESFARDLVLQGNLSAATALAHLVLHADAEHYQFSHQFWSLMASEAVRNFHFAAANLVYHEIVDPYWHYSAENPSTYNTNVPFLLLPTMLEGLALVFARKGDSHCVEGLKKYFKRYFSYFGHSSVYQALQVARVEARARSGDLESALEAFKELCYAYRGHMKFRKDTDADHSLKYISDMNYKDRESKLEKFFETHSADDLPDVDFNKYSRAGVPRWAIIRGHIYMADLPEFRGLLTNHVRELVNGNSSVVDGLMTVVKKNHHAMHRFLIVALCDLGEPLLAWAVFNRTVEAYTWIHDNRNYTNYEEFAILARLVRKAFSSNDLSVSSYQLHKTLLGCYLFVKLKLRSQQMPGKYLREHLLAMLASPHSNLHEISELLSQIGDKALVLDEPAFSRLQALELLTHNIKLAQLVLGAAI